MKYFISTLMAAACLLTACSSDENIKPVDPNGKEDVTPPGKDYGTETDIFHADYVSKRAIALDETQQHISEKANDFAWTFFSKAFEKKEKGKSILLSPLSLTQNMAMLCNSMKGETLFEMMSVLGVSGYELEQVNAFVQQLNKGLDEADSRTKYRTDNAVWYEETLTLNPDFVQRTTPYYHLDIFPSPMDAQTLDAINDWACKSTFGRIEKMVTKLPTGCQSVIMNTVYFRGLWNQELTEKDIREDVFTNESGKAEKANMVAFTQISPYGKGELCQFTTRHFGNGAFAMDFVLPKEGATATEALHEYINIQANTGLEKIVELEFPVFEASTETGLNELLKHLGMDKFINGENPEDFCLFDTPAGQQQVIQKTSLAVSEKGTEAAAGTYVMDIVSPGEEKPEIVQMNLNRPFFYTIRETSTNTPLFIGYLGSIR